MDTEHYRSGGLWGLAGCFLLGLTIFFLSACLAAPQVRQPTVVSQVITYVTEQNATRTLTAVPLLTSTPEPITTPDAILVPHANATSTPVFYEPAGCWQPPDDYSRVQIAGITLNNRTFTMLQQAAQLYAGEIDVAGKAIIRGSFTDQSLDSPEEHSGGGAVDISVFRLHTQSVLYNEIEPLIRALRTVGFAAWLRDFEVNGTDPGIHIHAVAIGDNELSPAAREELDGPAGYLRGYDGLPITSGNPGLDRHGGPLICGWMKVAGFADLRTPTPASTPTLPWQERLRLAALAYLADFPEDAEKVARSLNFLDGQSESAQNICGPLSGAILRDAGLLPTQVGPVHDLKSYWQARPNDNGRPWSLFPERDYEVFRYDTPLAAFDFHEWPLQPGDFLYTYAIDHGFEHMFIVTEVDDQGRAYTVTNQYQAWGNKLWGTMLIQRYMLYDPQTPGAGIIYNEWSDRRLGTTGHSGFEVLRKRGMTAGTLYEYTVRPGDTLPDIARRFEAPVESLLQANPGQDVINLQIGQSLTIPIPTYTPRMAPQVEKVIP